MERSETPVLLLTGYLGSGKTTLVNRILNNKRGIKFAVIVNDIGEVNIDASLIEKGGIVGKKDDSLVALQNGCICCTLKMDLIEQLHDITRTHRFDYIVIEASGICEAVRIAQTICSMPQMGAEYMLDGLARLDCICAVVDALRLKDEFGCGGALLSSDIDEEDIENLVIQQIEFCNIVLLNKTSMVEPNELARVKEIIRTLQPKAEIVECDYCDVDLDKILNTGMFDFDKVATSAAWIREMENLDDDEHEHEHHHHDDDEHDDEHEHEHHHGHHHHHHHDEGEVEEYGIGTFVYKARRPFDINRFDYFVARNWPKGIIRAKGICYFKSESHICYLFEQAGKQVSLNNAGQWYATMPDDELQEMLMRDESLRRDWLDPYGDRQQKLVFIGQHLDRDAITQALNDCLVDF